MIAALRRAKWTGSVLQDGVFTIPSQNRMKPPHSSYCHDTSISISHSFTVILAVFVICDLSEPSQLPPILQHLSAPSCIADNALLNNPTYAGGHGREADAESKGK